MDRQERLLEKVVGLLVDVLRDRLVTGFEKSHPGEKHFGSSACEASPPEPVYQKPERCGALVVA
jgi:hypothetical protein